MANLKVFVPEGHDYGECYYSVGGGRSDCLYFDENDEQVIVAIPRSCSLHEEGLSMPSTYRDFDIHKAGRWYILNMRDEVVAEGKLRRRIVDCS